MSAVFIGFDAAFVFLLHKVLKPIISLPGIGMDLVRNRAGDAGSSPEGRLRAMPTLHVIALATEPLLW